MARRAGGFGDVDCSFGGGWIGKDTDTDTDTDTQDTFSFGGKGTVSGFTLAAYWEQNLDES
jgi:hypothetical protein